MQFRTASPIIANLKVECHVTVLVNTLEQSLPVSSTPHSDVTSPLPPRCVAAKSDLDDDIGGEMDRAV